VTADEIRGMMDSITVLMSKTPMSTPQIATEMQVAQLKFLSEIAAQLAELNWRQRRDSAHIDGV
jgi:hypothetical protein